MLRLLRIRNFAIIDELELEFHEGFNAITGETGAGKSIILDAIGLLLGNRASGDLLRTGCDEATVEALFDLDENDAFGRKLEAHGIDVSGREILVKRTVQRTGKNKIFLNGELITLNQLADICENLVELCSQHEHQSLSKPAYQLDLLDRYGGLLERRRDVRETHAQLRSRENELASLGGDERERARAIDFLRFQLEEIDEFGPKEGEEEALDTERRRLANATQLMESAQHALELVGGESGDGGDVRTLLGKAQQRLTKAAQLDPALQPALDAVARAGVEADEAVSQLSSYATGLELDPARLEEVEERLARWSELKKKYGASAAEILATRAKIEAELADWDNRATRLRDLETEIAELRKIYEKTAGDLSKRRRNVAKTLRESIVKELRELMMPGTSFEVELATAEAPSADGIDKAQFLFSPNPGEGLKPIAKIASGGELSRVMLAIRRTIADRGGIGVYLFDEIDAGIGGQTASIVGRKLKSVAGHNQIICITHLPQVAAFADAHYSVTKKVSGGRTISQITLLEGPKRIEEVARMLGGLNITEKSRAHARDLIRQASV
jgi:DNA repair protein RecN (Recombination protein N)